MHNAQSNGWVELFLSCLFILNHLLAAEYLRLNLNLIKVTIFKTPLHYGITSLFLLWRYEFSQLYTNQCFLSILICVHWWPNFSVTEVSRSLICQYRKTLNDCELQLSIIAQNEMNIIKIHIFKKCHIAILRRLSPQTTWATRSFWWWLRDRLDLNLQRISSHSVSLYHATSLPPPYHRRRELRVFED